MISLPLRIVLSAAFAVYGIAAVPSGLDRMTRDEPALESAVIPPFRAQADRSATMTALIRQQAEQALAFATAAVDRDPVDPDSTALLGSAYELADRPEEQDRAFRVAALFGWRNLATQGYFMDLALQNREFEMAADRVDAMMRSHPRLIDVEELFAPFEDDATGRKVLAEHLALKPSWLERYVKTLAGASPQRVVNRTAVISLLPADKPLGCDLVTPLANALIGAGKGELARAMWNRNCPEQAIDGPLGDVRFAHVPSPGAPAAPFTWAPRRSGDVAIQSANDGSDGLTIRNSAPFPNMVISQPVSLSPGVYRVVLDGDFQGQGNPGVIAAFGCDGRFPLAATPNGNALSGGQDIVATGCKNEELGLWLAGGGASVRLRSIKLDTSR